MVHIAAIAADRRAARVSGARAWRVAARASDGGRLGRAEQLGEPLRRSGLGLSLPVLGDSSC